jgi:hypothetical protein
MMGHSTTKAAGVTGLDLLTQGFEVSGWHAIPADQVWPAPPQGTGLAAGMASAASLDESRCAVLISPSNRTRWRS